MKQNYSELPNGYLESINKGINAVRNFRGGMTEGKLSRDEAIARLKMEIETADAIATARDLIKLDGLSAGISGGANIAAILELAKRGEIKPGAKVVTVLPDGSDKYLSTALGA